MKTIVSYGLIMFCITNEEVYFLLYQRRDTFEYMDFLRGKWEKESDVKDLLFRMKNSERERLMNYSFQDLWDDLWVTHSHYIYHSINQARSKYNRIAPRLEKLIINTPINTKKESLWGFPKGKKNTKETPLECAKREFIEETRLDIEHSIVFKELIEKYQGSNSQKYKTHYFVGECQNIVNVDKVNIPNRIRSATISDEASEVKWVKFREALKLLNERRKKILMSVYLNIIARNVE